ncbi:MAG: Amuc_1100 family pilus-like protein [Verrucomicrobiota bacterium]
MSWIKRNLFFALGGIIALGLLGGAGFYTYKGWSRNSDAKQKLNESYGMLNSLAQKNPAPGNEEINNTAIAIRQEQQLGEWISGAKAYFRPVPLLASNINTSESFVGLLQRTVDQLQRSAADAGVLLPPKYYFSFAAQKGNFDLDTNSLGALATQLAEVKSVVEILFAAHVNALDGVQRSRVATSDGAGSGSDFTDQNSVSNDLAVITPYTVTFRCFSLELSRVIAGFAASSNAFIVKSIIVQPASVATTPGGTPEGAANPASSPVREPAAETVAPPAARPVSARGGLKTILKEQLLRVTMEVKLVKLLPKS